MLVGLVGLTLWLWSSGNGTDVYDLDGGVVDPLAGKAAATVLVFVRSDCPISNRYTPEVQRLAARFMPQGAAFWLVYVDPGQGPASIRRHLREYGYSLPAAHDPDHVLVHRTGAKVTPQAAVFNADGVLVYSGRIDDRYIDFDQARNKAQRHEVEEVLKAVLAGEPVEMAWAPAVGCFIADLKR